MPSFFEDALGSRCVYNRKYSMVFVCWYLHSLGYCVVTSNIIFICVTHCLPFPKDNLRFCQLTVF